MIDLTAAQRDFRQRFDRAMGPLPGRVTSYWRSEKRNREVGGAQHSQHLYGLAADLVTSREHWDDAKQRLRAEGLVVIDEGDHIHAQRFAGRFFKGSILTARTVTVASRRLRW